MKNLILVSATVLFSTNIFASTVKDCFVTDKCVQTMTACQIDESEYNRSVAYARIRTNVRYGCPTSSGIHYVWEQGDVKAYSATDYYGDSKEHQANAMKMCKERLANYISDEGTCSK